MSDDSTSQKFAVIGAGFSGISAAFYLQSNTSKGSRNKTAPNVTVFESTDRVAGVVRSVRKNGFLLEESADSFIINEQVPWAGQLAKDAGFESQLIPTNEEFRRAFVLHRGETHPVPDGFRLMAATKVAPVLRSKLLSFPAKLRVLRERWIAGQPEKTVSESLQEFAVRRVGQEAFDHLIQPLVSGIYTADPEKLSIAAALPQFVELEKRFGSLTAGLRQQAKKAKEDSAGARYGMFRTAKNGLESFVQHVADQLEHGAVRLGSGVTKLERSTTESGAKWIVESSGPAGTQRESFDGVVLATPAPITSQLLQPQFADLSREIGDIEHAGVAVVCLGYRVSDIRHPLDAFGMVIPTIEKQDAVAISFSHRKFPDRAPKDHVLLRVFLGGALRPDLVQLPDEELTAIAVSQVEKTLGANGEPAMQHLTRWRSVTPQYHVGHLERVAGIESLAEKIPNLAIAGNAFRGIGIPQCIRSGMLAAQSLLSGPR